MNAKLAELLAQALALPEDERRRLIQLLLESSAEEPPFDGVRDAGEPYRSGGNTPSTQPIDMTSVTLVLPDELAKQAKDAGLLAGNSLEGMIRRALQERINADPLAPDADAPIQQRRLVRENGYLVVEALPGEKPITDAEVRNLLNDMEW